MVGIWEDEGLRAGPSVRGAVLRGSCGAARALACSLFRNACSNDYGSATVYACYGSRNVGHVLYVQSVPACWDITLSCSQMLWTNTIRMQACASKKVMR